MNTATLSYESYLELPYTGQKTEFVDGAIIEVNPPTRRHIDIADNLYLEIRQHVKIEGLSLVCRQSSAQVAVRYQGRKRRGRLPDLFVCTIDQWAAIASDKSAVFPVGNPPLLVIEILSPGNWRNDMGEKEADYATARVPEYWRINPMEQWVEVLSLGEAHVYESDRFSNGEQVISGILPKMKLSVQQIFEV